MAIEFWVAWDFIRAPGASFPGLQGTQGRRGETGFSLVNGELWWELKAVETLVPLHKAQVISYLRATGLHLPLLIDLNVLALRAGIRRIVLSSS